VLWPPPSGLLRDLKVVRVCWAGSLSGGMVWLL